MSHAHVLTLDHPLAFTDHAEGCRSLARVVHAPDRRALPHMLIVPGHGRPFFVTARLWQLAERAFLARR